MDDLGKPGTVPVERHAGSRAWRVTTAALHMRRPAELQIISQTFQNVSYVTKCHKSPDLRNVPRTGTSFLLMLRLTCDSEAVGGAGVWQDVGRSLVVLKQALPLSHVVSSKEIQRFWKRRRRYWRSAAGSPGPAPFSPLPDRTVSPARPSAFTSSRMGTPNVLTYRCRGRRPPEVAVKRPHTP